MVRLLCLCAQSCPTLCDPMDRSLPGFSNHGISQARILEWVAMPCSRGSSRSEERRVSCHVHLHHHMPGVRARSCPTLRDPMDCSPPGSSVHGISRARILEWVTISYSRGCSQSRDQTHIFYISCIVRQIFFFFNHCATWEPPKKMWYVYTKK